MKKTDDELPAEMDTAIQTVKLLARRRVHGFPQSELEWMAFGLSVVVFPKRRGTGYSLAEFTAAEIREAEDLLMKMN